MLDGRTTKDHVIERVLFNIGRTLIVLSVFFIFFLSVVTIGDAMKQLSEGKGRELIKTVHNPIVGLFVGLLVTSLIHSSAATVSIVVTLVAGGTLELAYAVPIVMGAEIGTTVTNTMVSLTQMGRKEEFRRAMSGAMVHDMFNVLTVLCLFPLELATHFIQYTATKMAEVIQSLGGLNWGGLKKAFMPLADACLDAGKSVFPDPWSYIVVAVLAVVVLCMALFVIVRIMRRLAEGRFETLFDKYVGKYPYRALFLGAVMTAVIQSSSVVTSTIVPIVGAGVLTLEQIYPVVLGANIGTTATAVLIALALTVAGKPPVGLAIALVHTICHTLGVIIWFVIPGTKRVPISMAKYMGGVVTKRRFYAVVFTGTVFYLVPMLIILLYGLLRR
jgi:sodium-dependent phosphate cotransporter